MNSPIPTANRLRAILDACLILLLVLLLSVQGQQAMAGTANPPFAAAAPLPSAASAGPVPDQVQVTIPTAAAMMAAENAALGLPQYLVDLPIIHR